MQRLQPASSSSYLQIRAGKPLAASATSNSIYQHPLSQQQHLLPPDSSSRLHNTSNAVGSSSSKPFQQRQSDNGAAELYRLLSRDVHVNAISLSHSSHEDKENKNSNIPHSHSFHTPSGKINNVLPIPLPQGKSPLHDIFSAAVPETFRNEDFDFSNDHQQSIRCISPSVPPPPNHQSNSSSRTQRSSTSFLKNSIIAATNNIRPYDRDSSTNYIQSKLHGSSFTNISCDSSSASQLLKKVPAVNQSSTKRSESARESSSSQQMASVHSTSFDRSSSSSSKGHHHYSNLQPHPESSSLSNSKHHNNNNFSYNDIDQSSINISQLLNLNTIFQAHTKPLQKTPDPAQPYTSSSSNSSLAASRHQSNQSNQQQQPNNSRSLYESSLAQASRSIVNPSTTTSSTSSNSSSNNNSVTVANSTIESTTTAARLHELALLKKDLKTAITESQQWKSKLRRLEQDHKALKATIESERKHRPVIDDCLARLKGTQFLLAHEKRTASKLQQEVIIRNQNVQMILENLANIIVIIQRKVDASNISRKNKPSPMQLTFIPTAERALVSIKASLSPILQCLEPVIEDIKNHTIQLLSCNSDESQQQLQTALRPTKKQTLFESNNNMKQQQQSRTRLNVQGIHSKGSSQSCNEESSGVVVVSSRKHQPSKKITAGRGGQTPTNCCMSARFISGSQQQRSSSSIGDRLKPSVAINSRDSQASSLNRSTSLVDMPRNMQIQQTIQDSFNNQCITTSSLRISESTHASSQLNNLAAQVQLQEVTNYLANSGKDKRGKEVGIEEYEEGTDFFEFSHSPVNRASEQSSSCFLPTNKLVTANYPRTSHSKQEQIDNSQQHLIDQILRLDVGHHADDGRYTSNALVSSSNGNSSLNNSQKLFNETLKGLSETLKNLRLEEEAAAVGGAGEAEWMNDNGGGDGGSGGGFIVCEAVKKYSQPPVKQQTTQTPSQQEQKAAAVEQQEDIASLCLPVSRTTTEQPASLPTSQAIELLKNRILQRQSMRKLNLSNSSSNIQQLSQSTSSM